MKRCNQCNTGLTDEATIAIDGNHEHHVANSAGVKFTVHCYAEAANAAPTGPASHDHTWFAGHTWRRLFCKHCNSHVGWQFRSRSRVFCALIAGATSPRPGCYFLRRVTIRWWSRDDGPPA